MVKSETTSITPATHAARHAVGGADPLVNPLLLHASRHTPGNPDTVFVYTVTTDVLCHNTTPRSVSSVPYAKAKGLTLTTIPNSSLSIAFDLAASHDLKTVYGKIYRNGGAVGIEQSCIDAGGGAYEEKLETIAGWSDGDELELYIKNGTDTTVMVKDLEIRGTVTPHTVVSNDP